MLNQPMRAAALDDIARHFIDKVGAAIPQHLANSSWAVARLWPGSATSSLGSSPLNGQFMDVVIMQVGIHLKFLS